MILVRCLCSFSIVYAMVTFVNLQWDVTQWSEASRFAVVVFGLWLAFCWTLINDHTDR